MLATTVTAAMSQASFALPAAASPLVGLDGDGDDAAVVRHSGNGEVVSVVEWLEDGVDRGRVVVHHHDDSRRRFCDTGAHLAHFRLHITTMSGLTAPWPLPGVSPLRTPA
jgi:hypothetical protein